MILFWAEQKDGELTRTSLEILSEGRRLAESIKEDLGGVLIGEGIASLSENLGKRGVKKVFVADEALLKEYQTDTYTQIFTNLIEKVNPSVLLFPHNSSGKDLAPRLAARLNVGLISDCIQLEINNGSIIGTRPMYTEKALARVTHSSETKPVILTLRQKAFSITEEMGDGNFESVNLDVSSLSSRTEIIEVKKIPQGTLDVAEADIVVSGGRGLKGSENFSILEELATRLGAAVGASRAVVDAGWRDHKDQVGQTGKLVSPKLYIACGISGAIQHQVGMRNSKWIVAINKDPNAPIFKLASYGIVGDLFQIVPLITEELKKQ
jgi:electron transfer flavoprotein alpha subunit